jgi:hypothetical protein
MQFVDRQAKQIGALRKGARFSDGLPCLLVYQAKRPWR